MSNFSRRAVVQSLLATAVVAAIPVGAIASLEAPAVPVAAALVDTETALQWWELFTALSPSDKLRYAALLRAEPYPGLHEMADQIEAYVANWEAHAKQA